MTTVFSANSSFATEQGIAIAVNGNINFRNPGLVTVYNGFPCSKVVVRTNSIAPGAVTLADGLTINGDVVIGPGGDPDVVINGSGAVITGDVYVAGEPMLFISVEVPTYLASMPSGGSIKNTTTLSVSGKYDSIDLGNNEMLIITEPVSLYITGDITLGNNAKIVIGDPNLDPDNDASLTMYLAGNIEGKNSSGFFNLTQDASNLLIYALNSSTHIYVRNGADWYGFIYAPSADVLWDNSGMTYGDVFANSFDMKNSGIFYYDASPDGIPGDINGDLIVDFLDYTLFADRWMETGCGFCGGADMTWDGSVGYRDLKAFANTWLCESL